MLGREDVLRAKVVFGYVVKWGRHMLRRPRPFHGKCSWLQHFAWFELAKENRGDGLAVAPRT